MLMTGMGRRHPDVYQSMAGLGECDDWGICDTPSVDTSGGGTNWAPLWSLINQVTGAATNVIRTTYGTVTPPPGGYIRRPDGTIVTGGYGYPTNPGQTGAVAGISTQTLLIGGAAFVLLLVMMRKR